MLTDSNCSKCSNTTHQFSITNYDKQFEGKIFLFTAQNVQEVHRTRVAVQITTSVAMTWISVHTTRSVCGFVYQCLRVCVCVSIQ